TAQGAQPLMFQWYFNQTNSLVDQTNATLELNNVSPANAGTYLVVVSNPYGIATSAPVSLTVLVPAAIVTSPVDQIVAFGGTALFSVLAVGTEPLAYQWYFEGEPVPEATTSELVLASVTEANTGSYGVTVSNAYGQAVSTPASLTVLRPPTILRQPVDQIVALGAPAQLTVGADGTAPLAYQWWFNGAPLDQATSASLVLSQVQTDHAGAYVA